MQFCMAYAAMEKKSACRHVMAKQNQMSSQQSTK